MEFKIPEFSISLKLKGEPPKDYFVNTSSECADICRMCFDADQLEWVESFIVVALNTAHKVIGFYKVSSGGVTMTVADPKVIFQFALLSNATNIIIAHNHPSGSLKPSEADKSITKKIADAGKLLDIKVLDHIIITASAHYSFADDGTL